jgi:hypothetical protein
MKIKHLAILPLMGLLWACEKPQESDLLNLEDGFINAKVATQTESIDFNSIVGIAVNHPKDTSILQIEGTDHKTKNILIINGKFKSPGIYKASDTSKQAFIYYLKINSSTKDTVLYSVLQFSGTEQLGSVNIDVQNLTNTRIKGVFDAVLYSDAMDSLLIDKGTFDVQIVE